MICPVTVARGVIPCEMAKREVSAGGVVFKRGASGIRVCLIGKKTYGRFSWGLPKGHLEKGEKPELAAEREVKEETGLQVRFVRPIQWIKYSYVEPKTRVLIFKIVNFYLFRYVHGTTEDHDWEVEEVRWFSLDEAIRKATYPSEREVLVKVRRLLRRRGV